MRALSWLGLVAVVVGSLALVGIPVWLIQPFAPQSADALAWSHTIKRVAPQWSTAALVVAGALGWRLWRRPDTGARARGRWQIAAARIAIVLLVLVAAAPAWFSRQNHFEWMFRPNADPSFAAAGEVTDVDPHEPVIGVTLGSEALAFPITRIGYHHLVNTTIARKPIVATY